MRDVGDVLTARLALEELAMFLNSHAINNPDEEDLDDEELKSCVRWAAICVGNCLLVGKELPQLWKGYFRYSDIKYLQELLAENYFSDEEKEAVKAMVETWEA